MPFFYHLRMVLLLPLLLVGCGGADDVPAKRPVVVNQAKPKPKSKAPPRTETDANDAASPPPTAVHQSRTPTAAVEKIHRPEDTRPVRNDKELAKLGFVKITSPRLILYSDLPEQELKNLPDAIEQLVNLMGAYFGPLPPDRQEKAYQMTGYLMGDAARFRDAGILVEGPAQPHEGWYLGNEFWLNKQATDYYTRHLMLHEAAHCFMHVMPNVDCPPWYVEGMAELFGTHHKDDKGQYLFGIFPDHPDRNPGWARVSVLQGEIADGKLPDVEQIIAYTFDDFSKLPPYAWSWAFCHYLNTHPRYKVPFQKLAKSLYDGGFAARATELFDPLLPDLRDEWLLYASQIQYGHNIERSVINFQPGRELTAQKLATVSVLATQGWQPTRISVMAGKSYQVRATGQFTLATTTKPWISEAQGISIRYFAGQPLGRLMGTIRPEPSGKSNRDILKLIPLGPDATFTAQHSGTLYLRLNDAWNALEDNAGEVQVTVEIVNGR